jgi:phospholipid/cholesterol/gamma-HCH transport system ATP-binding protein
LTRAPTIKTPSPEVATPAAIDSAESEKFPIEVRGLVSCFGENVVHDGLDLKVERGEVLGVVGGSGTGKSVLLNTIIGLKIPDGGQVRLFGGDMRIASRRRWSSVERRWGVLFQQGALFSNLTVRENVAAPLFEHTKLPRREIDEIADLKIAMVGLPARAATLKPAELSGGMRKRAGLARALAMDPELLFLDEPTAGLDPIGAQAFDALIKDLSDSLDLTVFMITHDLDSLYAITDRVAVLADKKVVAVAPVRELERSDHPWIKQYFLGPRGRAAATAEPPEARTDY